MADMVPYKKKQHHQTRRSPIQEVNNFFGHYKSRGNSVINTMILLAKQFIWTEKFGRKDLNELHYILFMQKELKLLLDTMQFGGKNDTFCLEWTEIFQHFEVQIQ